MTLWPRALLGLFLLLSISCSPDYGVVTNEEVVVENVIIEEVVEEVIEETVGESVLEQGYIYNQALDILFIVDESGSMSDEQEMLATYIPDMYLSLVGNDFSDLEWRVMLRSADPDDESYGWVGWDDANAEYKLNALFSYLGQSGYYEQGIDVAVQSTAFDDDFHRQEADLLIIFVSDEPDQSSYSVASYESLISTFKSHPFKTTEAAIVYSDTDAATYPECNVEQIGTGYIDVAEQIASFCDPSRWENILAEARDHVPELNEEWPLSEIPYDPDTIRVFANADEWFDWYYDEPTNTVYLTDIPDVGTLISIIYVIEAVDTGT